MKRDRATELGGGGKHEAAPLGASAERFDVFRDKRSKAVLERDHLVHHRARAEQMVAGPYLRVVREEHIPTLVKKKPNVGVREQGRRAQLAVHRTIQRCPEGFLRSVGKTADVGHPGPLPLDEERVRAHPPAGEAEAVDHRPAERARRTEIIERYRVKRLDTRAVACARTEDHGSTRPLWAHDRAERDARSGPRSDRCRRTAIERHELEAGSGPHDEAIRSLEGPYELR